MAANDNLGTEATGVQRVDPADGLAANQALWDTWAEIHGTGPNDLSYNVEEFLAGRQTLRGIERELVGDVAGKDLLHLQCHFGMDTLSWARLGARVTGVDFSPWPSPGPKPWLSMPDWPRSSSRRMPSTCPTVLRVGSILSLPPTGFCPGSRISTRGCVAPQGRFAPGAARAR